MSWLVQVTFAPTWIPSVAGPKLKLATETRRLVATGGAFVGRAVGAGDGLANGVAAGFGEGVGEGVTVGATDGIAVGPGVSKATEPVEDGATGADPMDEAAEQPAATSARAITGTRKRTRRMAMSPHGLVPISKVEAWGHDGSRRCATDWPSGGRCLDGRSVLASTPEMVSAASIRLYAKPRPTDVTNPDPGDASGTTLVLPPAVQGVVRGALVLRDPRPTQPTFVIVPGGTSGYGLINPGPIQ